MYPTKSSAQPTVTNPKHCAHTYPKVEKTKRAKFYSLTWEDTWCGLYLAKCIFFYHLQQHCFS